MTDLSRFEFFDKKQETVITSGHLPHWFQPGVTYFVTFRTEDSVPQSLVKSWYRSREDWLKRKGVDLETIEGKGAIICPPKLRDEYHKRFTKTFMDYMDRGLGECLLSLSENAKQIAEALMHFDNERYLLGDFVVMPNHVHVLVCLLGESEIKQVCKSWKTYTARKINLHMQRTGRLWQEESFDHMVRDPDHFERFQRYIADNPKKANLESGSYLLRTLVK